MKPTHIVTFFATVLLVIGLYGCKKEEYKFGKLTAPAIPEVEISLEGQDQSNPYGNGSGNVTVTVKADGAISYKVDFGDGKPAKISTANQFNYSYSLPTGNSTLIITVMALGKGGTMSTNSKEITIYRAFTPNPELVQMLTGEGSKTWVVDKEAAGNLGVGPAESFWPEWWAAAPNEKAGLGIYDDEYTFNQSNLTFTHTTNNDLFGKKEYLKDFDPSLSGDGDYTLSGVGAASYTEKFGYDGGPNGEEYITFSNKGHLGMYLGVHRYQIVERSENHMMLRCLQDPGAWYVKIVAK